MVYAVVSKTTGPKARVGSTPTHGTNHINLKNKKSDQMLLANDRLASEKNSPNNP